MPRKIVPPRPGERPRDVPVPTIRMLREIDPNTAAAIEMAARKQDRTLPEFLGDLVWSGFQHQAVEGVV